MLIYTGTCIFSLVGRRMVDFREIYGGASVEIREFYHTISLFIVAAIDTGHVHVTGTSSCFCFSSVALMSDKSDHQYRTISTSIYLHQCEIDSNNS